MISLEPRTLEGHGVRLEPLSPDHAPALRQAVSDGRLWELWYTAVPEPDKVPEYIAAALRGLGEGQMLPWAVRELTTGAIVGSTRYHDVVAAIDRVEIGYTWYAARWQRTHVNTACKLLLLRHAFESLGCRVVGFRTDNFNFASQRAIAALGARRDGVIRHHYARRDGTVRDSVMYSILAAEWPDVKRHLMLRLDRRAEASGRVEPTADSSAPEAGPPGGGAGAEALPIACTLTPEELRERRGGLLPGLVAEAAEAERIPGGLRWKFPPAPGLARRIGDVIETEHGCCRFLRFRLIVEPGDGWLWLEATGGEGTREFLSELLALGTGT